MNLLRNAYAFTVLIVEELLGHLAGPSAEVVDAVTLPGLPAETLRSVS